MSSNAKPRPIDKEAHAFPAATGQHGWRLRLEALRSTLLDWYAQHRRDLPWRGISDPYAILVSEVMLQQTQVERVIPKYRQFLERFPSLQTLAEAERAEVIRSWVPLGYNRRAVRLHELAQHVVANGGELPRTVDGLLALRGLGSYTSAAVACFAFAAQVPTLDTNVRRVLTRLLADKLGNHPTERQLSAAAREVLPTGRASDWNQALMDLGATTCTAGAPACFRCPAIDWCASRGPRERISRAAESAAPYRPAQPFAGSSRYYRGQIVQALQALPAGQTIDLDSLGARLRDDFGPALREWLVGLLDGLERDGLARLEQPLGAHQGVGPAATADGERRVRLP